MLLSLWDIPFPLLCSVSHFRSSLRYASSPCITKAARFKCVFSFDGIPALPVWYTGAWSQGSCVWIVQGCCVCTERVILIPVKRKNNGELGIHHCRCHCNWCRIFSFGFFVCFGVVVFFPPERKERKVSMGKAEWVTRLWYRINSPRSYSVFCTNVGSSFPIFIRVGIDIWTGRPHTALWQAPGLSV